MELLYKSVMSIHIVAVISWMAGILYLFRLFIYHQEETEDVVKARFEIMEERLFRIITVPAMAVAMIMGILMLSIHYDLIFMPWLWAKLVCVVLLMGLTMRCGGIRRSLAAGQCPFTSKQLRILNEVPTLLMILIVFLVILKPFSG